MINAFVDFMSRGCNYIICMTAVPVLFGFLMWLFRKHSIMFKIAAFVSAGLNLAAAFGLYAAGDVKTSLPFSAYGFEADFRIYGMSSLFLVFTAAVFLLIAVYSAYSVFGKKYAGLYMLCLYSSLAMVNGALLADNLSIMLFFWEGMLCTLTGILLMGNSEKPKTAVKALTMCGISDLLLMLGLVITSVAAETAKISEISEIPATGAGAVGFALLILGAVGKAGGMPFHSWIPDAASDAPAAFMAVFPGAFGKILGVYFITRTITDIYAYKSEGTAGILIMVLGLITVIYGAAKALWQKDMKRQFAYISVSQFGFILLGAGTGLLAGISGILSGMFMQVISITGLFIISDAVGKRFGTTEIKKITGFGRKMPVAAVCFTVFALSIVGFPVFGGFFSNMLILNAAAETGIVYYIAGLAGIFLTALAFIKTGFAIFGGNKNQRGTREEKKYTGTTGIAAPAIILAVACAASGIWNSLITDNIIGRGAGLYTDRGGWHNALLPAAVSMCLFASALWLRIYISRKPGSLSDTSGEKKSLPETSVLRKMAEAGKFDPYNILMACVGFYSDICTAVEHGVSWIYDTAVPGAVKQAGMVLHRFDNGLLSRYLILAVCGTVGIFAVFLIVLM